MSVLFSDYFNVSNETMEQYGAFNISLIGDLPLFIDPFLLFYSTNEKYRNLHNEIIKYMIFLREKSKENLSEAQIKDWFVFSEQKENWLGYSNKRKFNSLLLKQK